MSSTPGSGAPTLRINQTRLRIEATRLGLDGETAIAAHIGVGAAQLARYRKGQFAPSATVIARMLRAFPELKFTDLFEVVEKAAA